jgi:hypothetical protein
MKKKKRSLTQYVAGTSATGVSGSMGGLYNQIPGILDGIIGMLENDPKAYSKEPTVNASVVRNMVSPYAFGGQENGMDEEQLAQLQQMADDNGITIEELISQLQQGGNEEEGEDPTMYDNEDEEYALGTGLYGIGGGDEDDKKKRKTKAERELSNDTVGGTIYNKYSSQLDENGKPVGRNWEEAVKANLKYFLNNITGEFTDAPNPSNVYRPENQHMVGETIIPELQNYGAYGGEFGKNNIEVEGEEVVETPNGQVSKMKGPSHENGGINLSVPDGTKIFSDRIQVDGKTMQQRKVSRERVENRIRKAIGKDPTSNIAKNTLKRTIETNEMEEAKDMAIQKSVASIMSGQPMIGTSNEEEKFAFGGASGDEPYFDKTGWHYPKGKKYALPNTMSSTPTGEDLFHNNQDFLEGLNPTHPDYVDPSTPRVTDTPYSPSKDTSNPITESNGLDLTAGDYVGLAGNAFNAIAPIINTIKNAEGNKPNVNRFRGFGRKALEANDTAQNLAAKAKGYAMTDLNTSKNSSFSRNRNSAQSVNTVRALDIATDMASDKAANNVNTNYVKESMSLLGQRASLENQKDAAEMKGETARDTEDKADRDNFYSNMAQNLVNAGTNVQGIGRSLNTAKSNKIDSNLISQLSQYGLAYDKNGKLITLKK